MTTIAKTPKGFSGSRYRIGRSNAAILPLPIWAMPSTSRPARISGRMWLRSRGLGFVDISILRSGAEEGTTVAAGIRFFEGFGDLGAYCVVVNIFLVLYASN
ncbi:hypothetical protein COP1_044216 [Malus domestica]